MGAVEQERIGRWWRGREEASDEATRRDATECSFRFVMWRGSDECRSYLG